MNLRTCRSPERRREGPRRTNVRRKVRRADMPRILAPAGLALWIVLACEETTPAQLVAAARVQSTSAAAESRFPPETELARVDGRSIQLQQVQQHLQRAWGDRPLDPTRVPRLYRETPELLIDRQLVLRMLQQQGQTATTADVDLAMRRWEEQRRELGAELDAIYQQRPTLREEMRAEFHWTLSWQRLLDAYRTDRNLERFFEQHRADYDGRRLRVAQILWRVEDAEALPRLEKLAQEVRREVLDGQLTFADAARRHSQSPSAAEGGELGWIERRDPMPEDFSRAAFQLEAGEISPPVTTTLGLHLIQCQEIEPGERGWSDVRPQLEQGFARFLFRWAAEKGRDGARIERHEGIAWDALPWPPLAAREESGDNQTPSP
jgi:parvulin-like peptidyl-prolyl isomerase